MNKKGKTKDGIEIEIIYSDLAKQQNIQEGCLTSLQMIIVDKSNESYEANVELHNGWTFGILQEIVTQTMLLCDDSVISVKATFLGAPILN